MDWLAAARWWPLHRAGAFTAGRPGVCRACDKFQWTGVPPFGAGRPILSRQHGHLVPGGEREGRASMNRRAAFWCRRPHSVEPTLSSWAGRWTRWNSGDGKKQFISIKFEAAATKQRLACLSTLVNLSLSEHLINGQNR